MDPKIKRRTLAIGLGGAGCLCIGYLKKALQEVGILPSPERLSSGSTEESDAHAQEKRAPVRLLGIDLDPDSAGSDDTKRADIKDDFLLLSHEALSRTIRDLEENTHWLSAWYPDSDRDYIKVKDAFTGASQWRPLGRMSYCLDQKRIENRIKAKLDALQALVTAHRV